MNHTSQSSECAATMESVEAFQERVAKSLSELGVSFDYDASESWHYEEDYQYIEKYAVENRLFYTAQSLPITRSLTTGFYRGTVTVDGVVHKRPFMCHCLSVAKYLIGLHAPLTRTEEDHVLAAAVCHDLISRVMGWEKREQLMSVYHMIPEIYHIVMLLSRNDYSRLEEQTFFNRIQENKLALLASLSDRGNIVEELYYVPVWKSHEYIYETRVFYLPMCIYAKEHYPELQGVISVLQEKMRTLVDVNEILVSRYEKQEMEMSNRILELKEENARMRTMIRRLKMNKKS